MCADEKVDEVAGGVSGIGVDRIAEVGDKTSEERAAGVYGASFTAGSLGRVGIRGGEKGLGIKVGYNVGRVAEAN